MACRESERALEPREAVRGHNVAEGAGAIGLAALLQDRVRGGSRVGTVLCGGNVDSDVFVRIWGNGSRFAGNG